MQKDHSDELKGGISPDFPDRRRAGGCTCLVIGIWLHQQLKLNPLSEIVEIDGAKVEIDWKPVEWEPGLSGVWLNNHKIERRGVGVEMEMSPLSNGWLRCHMPTTSGISRSSRKRIVGTTTEDWSSYVLHPFAWAAEPLTERPTSFSNIA